MSDKKKKKKKLTRKQRQKRKITFTVVAILLMLVLLVVAFVAGKLGKMDNIKLKTQVNDDLDTSSMKGYTTLALFGLDNRSNGNFDSGNSDTMIIVSINNKTGEIKMASLYRDTYLDIGDDNFNKANAAYSAGGVEQAVNMMNKNLDLNIEDSVAVDFNALVEVIDLLGGIEIELTDEEAAIMNGQTGHQDYIGEINQVTGSSSSYVSGGLQTLDGVQATAYARIRYTTGWDYKRTERQRLVLTKMFEKAKSAGIGTLNDILDAALPDVSTSLNATELMGLAAKISKYSMGENAGFPFDKDSGDIGNISSATFAIDFAGNVKQLHEFLYNDTDYTVSPTVQGISDTLKTQTGY